MAKLDWWIEQEGREPLCGSVPIAPGPCVVAPELPAGAFRRVYARMHVNMEAAERAFFNGYQTWTYCPEYARGDRIRGVDHLPKKLAEHYGLARYGDYFFVDYPNKPGHFHGESWCYFRKGERFRLIASLDEHMGYTLFRYDAGSHILDIERDCAGLAWPGGSFHAFDLFFMQGSEEAVFDAWFAAMGVTPRTTERIAGYSSWYNRYEKISAESIRQDLIGAIGRLKEGDLFQIDDGWEPAVGDWLKPDARKFPAGMKAAADAIHKAGFQAGLWLAPFVAKRGSEVWKQHPDWFLQVEGKPWYCGINWGGFYALDIDKPEVLDYLERVFHCVFDEWGYDLVKLDFLYAAAPFGNERETRAGRMIRAVELLRRLCGDKKILGCGVPLMPAFGLVDYCRISCDVGLDWNDTWLMQQIHRERVSTRQAIGNSIFRRELNGRAWLNDPDVFFLRAENLKLTAAQKEILATVNSLFGGVLLHSDNMADYDEKARQAYAQLLHNREAQNIRVFADRGLAVRYELDGEQRTLTIEQP